MYKEKFIYPYVSKEITSENGRVYLINDKPLYSVTTILGKMTDTSEIINTWKDRIGHDNANTIVKNSINKGSWMHDIIHYRLTEQKYNDKFPNNFLFQLTSKMADTIKVYLDKNLNEIWGSEVPVYVDKLYAGRIDCVGIYKGIPSIVDFKNSYKDKKEEHLENYKLQCAAYAVAHDYLFNTNIEQSVILICNSDVVATKEIIIGGKEFTSYKERWINMVEEFVKSEN